MPNNTLLIFDDDPGRAANWQTKLENLSQTKSLRIAVSERNEFLRAVGELESRRKAARTSKTNTWRPCIFDDPVILVLDYDLLEANGLSGEHVSYLARCYSECGIIVAINQFARGKSVFDLTLQGHPESFADLNIADSDISNQGLWANNWTGFRPWVWPHLQLERVRFADRTNSLIDKLDTTIFDFLELPKDITDTMPRSTMEFIEVGEVVTSTTFRRFVQDSPNCLDPKDRIQDDRSIARVAAARIFKWLDRMVLPGQDVLVDAPHLASRFPSLLVTQMEKPRSWTATLSLDPGEHHGLNEEVVKPFAFQKNDWLSRRVWLWPYVAECSDIAEVRDPWSKQTTPFVFCEDVSAFAPGDATREFVADIPSPFSRRYVIDVESEYGKEHYPDLRTVEYKPTVRFSL